MSTPNSIDSLPLPPAVVYTRVSPKPDTKGKALNKEDDPSSIEVQIASAQRYAVCWGFRIVQIIKDPDSSAGTYLDNRRQGRQLLDYLADNNIKHLIVQRIDRLFRDTVDGLLRMQLWSERGVVVHFADQGGCSIDTSTATGKLIFTCLLGHASFERELTGERTSISMLEQQRRGKAVGGVAPYGMMFDPDNPGRLIPNPREAGIRQQIIDMALTGLGHYQIANRLNKAGIPARGAEWRGCTIGWIIKRYLADVKSKGQDIADTVA